MILYISFLCLAFTIGSITSSVISDNATLTEEKVYRWLIAVVMIFSMGGITGFLLR